MLKTLAWALLTVLPFFLPNGAISAYGATRRRDLRHRFA
jgi:hypothetical protein